LVSHPNSVAAKLQPLEAVTASILGPIEERRAAASNALAKATCKEFTVGRGKLSPSSTVSLFPDRIEYKVSHPSQGRIDMVR
jgi:hypothetical protein